MISRANSIAPTVTKANYKVSIGDVVELELPPAVEPEVEPENLSLDILYEDADVIFVTAS